MLLFIATVLSNNKVISKFQYISCYCLSIWIPPCHCIKAISIHLMLLFIQSCKIVLPHYPIFQYISCYCLSWPKLPFQGPVSISIHLMLLFISTGSCHNKKDSGISIHLMLLFIGCPEWRWG